jgi:hypothetical protein
MGTGCRVSTDSQPGESSGSMNARIRKSAIKALECTAVVAVGIAVGPNSASAETIDDDGALSGESRTTLSVIQPKLNAKRAPDEQGRRSTIAGGTLDVLSGLDRTYVLCLAATSPVDKLRLAAARALAFPLYSVGERTALLHLLADPVPEVRAEAVRAATLRGTWADDQPRRS